MTETHGHITRLQFPNGSFIQAPTDQWVAFLFDVLHPTQQEAIVAKIQALQAIQQDRPLIEIPGFVAPSQKVVPQ